MIEFSKIANSITDTDDKFNCCIEDIYTIIDKSIDIANKSEIISSFWNLFVVDALICNLDRHLDDWGLLYNEKNKTYIFSPI